MDSICLLQEPVRLQDLLNSTYLQAEKNINVVTTCKKCKPENWVSFHPACMVDISTIALLKIQNKWITAPFNNMRTVKFKAQPTNAFFATVIQNVRRLLPAFDSYRARGNQIVVHSSDTEQSSAVVVSWEDPPNTWLTAAKNAFVGWAFNFRVRVLLKSAVIKHYQITKATEIVSLKAIHESISCLQFQQLTNSWKTK